MPIRRYVSIRFNFFIKNLDDFVVVAVIYLAIFDDNNIEILTYNNNKTKKRAILKIVVIYILDSTSIIYSIIPT